MHALLRPQVYKGPHALIRSCQEPNIAIQCVCVVNDRSTYKHDFWESRRSLSVASPKLFRAPTENSSVVPWFNLYNVVQFQPTRALSLSRINFEKPSSKVEATVQELKKQKETPTPAEVITKPVEKKSLRQKIVDELVHYYHGFRLLFIDMKISTVLVWRVLNGETLTRREYRLLIRTVGDMFRLVPFSVFVVVPFMEFLLPVFIKFFPGMLPSTFETASEKEKKIKSNLKIKLDMAKFLQETLDDMAVQHKDHKSTRAKEFSEWFQKVRTSGELVTTEEIMKFTKLFEDEITLDSLSRSQLIALCRVLDIQTLGTNNFLRFQLRMKLRSLAADDQMIERDGLDTLTLPELEQACRARGMRAFGLSEERLKSQLKQWLDLSLNEKVPPSLLLLSRALMLPETIPTSDKLKATISALPEAVLTHTSEAIGEKEGKIDNKVKLQVLKEEERKVKEERLRRKVEKKKEKRMKREVIVGKAPPTGRELETLASKAVEDEEERKEEQFQAKDIEVLHTAVDAVSKEKQYIVEKGELEGLKEHMADYKENVEDLEKAIAKQVLPEVKQSKAAQMLSKRLNKMISKLDKVVVNLEQHAEELKKASVEGVPDKKTKEQLVRVDEIISAIKRIKKLPDKSRIELISKVLKKMDDDDDGLVKVEHMLKVIEILGKENVNVNDKLMDDVMHLLDKEGILAVEDKIAKALQKSKEREANKAEDLKKTTTGGPKPKFQMKSRIVAPPINNIDKSKTSDNTKIL